MLRGISSQRAGRREWIGLAVLVLPCLLLSMDLTVLNLAIPAISADLRPSSAELLWIVDIYGFFIAGSLITMGTLGDRLGRRRLLLIGGAAFGLVSILAALSTSAEMLIASRALLGIAGATLMPSTMSLIRNMFVDDRQRSLAIGIWAASFAVGWALGPLVGGILLEHFWWGSVFLISVPVMILLLLLGPIYLPEYRNNGNGRLDLASATLSVAAVLAIIYGVKQIATEGAATGSLVMIAFGISCGALFARRQRSLDHPLIDLDLFRVRSFSVPLATNIFAAIMSFGALFFIAQYLQLVLGLSPLQAGIWSLPTAAASFIASIAAPIAARRLPPVQIITGGLLVAAGALAILVRLGPDSLPVAVGAAVLLTTGISPILALTTDLIVTAAPPERAGSSSALSETSIELGGALGVALLGSASVAVYRREVAHALPDGLAPEQAAAARDTLGAAVEVSRELPDVLSLALLDTTRDAFLHGLQLAATVGVGLALATAIFALALLRDRTPKPDPPPPPELAPIPRPHRS